MVGWMGYVLILEFVRSVYATIVVMSGRGVSNKYLNKILPITSFFFLFFFSLGYFPRTYIVVKSTTFTLPSELLRFPPNFILIHNTKTRVGPGRVQHRKGGEAAWAVNPSSW